MQRSLQVNVEDILNARVREFSVSLGDRSGTAQKWLKAVEVEDNLPSLYLNSSCFFFVYATLQTTTNSEQ